MQKTLQPACAYFIEVLVASNSWSPESLCRLVKGQLYPNFDQYFCSDIDETNGRVKTCRLKSICIIAITCEGPTEFQWTESK